MLRVALAEDHTAVRERLALYLAQSGRVRVVAKARNGADLLALLDRLPEADVPDVVVMDLEMPVLDGITTTARLHEAFPRTEVLVFTVFEDDDRLLAAIEAGAAGYLLKDQPFDEVLAATEELHAGGSPLSPPLARRLLTHVRDPHPSRPNLLLTDREVEVLALIVEGQTNAEMAGTLDISATTVKTHVRHIYEKLHVSSRAEATRRAIYDGLV